MDGLLNPRISQLEDELNDARETIERLERREAHLQGRELYLLDEVKRQSESFTAKLLKIRQDRDQLRAAVADREAQLETLRKTRDKPTAAGCQHGDLEIKVDGLQIDNRLLRWQLEQQHRETKERMEEAGEQRKKAEGTAKDAVDRLTEAEAKRDEADRLRRLADARMQQAEEALKSAEAAARDAEVTLEARRTQIEATVHAAFEDRLTTMRQVMRIEYQEDLRTQIDALLASKLVGMDARDEAAWDETQDIKPFLIKPEPPVTEMPVVAEPRTSTVLDILRGRGRRKDGRLSGIVGSSSSSNSAAATPKVTSIDHSDGEEDYAAPAPSPRRMVVDLTSPEPSRKGKEREISVHAPTKRSFSNSSPASSRSSASAAAQVKRRKLEDYGPRISDSFKSPVSLGSAAASSVRSPLDKLPIGPRNWLSSGVDQASIQVTAGTATLPGGLSKKIPSPSRKSSTQASFRTPSGSSPVDGHVVSPLVQVLRSSFAGSAPTNIQAPNSQKRPSIGRSLVDLSASPRASIPTLRSRQAVRTIEKVLPIQSPSASGPGHSVDSVADASESGGPLPTNGGSNASRTLTRSTHERAENAPVPEFSSSAPPTAYTLTSGSPPAVPPLPQWPNIPLSINARVSSYASLSIPPSKLPLQPSLRHSNFPGYVRREFFIAQYGGNKRYFINNISPERNVPPGSARNVMFPQRESQPVLPVHPGQPWILISDRDDVLAMSPMSLFVRAHEAVWLYMGNYELKRSDTPLTAAEFKALPEQVRVKWATEILQIQPWECYTSMRARIWLRKNEREITEKSVKDPVFLTSSAHNLSLSNKDVLRALDTGEEVLGLILCLPVSYDSDFRDDLVARHLEWEKSEIMKKASAASVGMVESQPRKSLQLIPVASPHPSSSGPPAVSQAASEGDSSTAADAQRSSQPLRRSVRRPHRRLMPGEDD